MGRMKIAVLTGAGISAESGIQTFRDNNGLWENHRVEDVASPEGWKRNRKLVQDFYNQRRKQVLQCQPNSAHYALADLQSSFEVNIITQNVDDLHERAGSKNVLHLHGELLKARSELDDSYVIDWMDDLTDDNRAPDGGLLRPNIVWFGEAVTKMTDAIPIIKECDFLVIIGTSLVVYPAAGLINYAKPEIPKWLIDPEDRVFPRVPNLRFIREKASVGMELLTKELNNLS